MDIVDALEKENLEVRSQVEIDRVQLGIGCPVGCVHCSRDPVRKRTWFMDADEFERIIKIGIQIKPTLLARYLLTDSDFDPFQNPDIVTICKLLLDHTGIRFYLLTSLLPPTTELRQSADYLASHPDLIERIAITISHFPLLVKTNYDQYINAVTDGVRRFLPLMKQNKLVLSPQFNDEDLHELYSEEKVMQTFSKIIARLGLEMTDVAHITYPRPVIGLGRAKTALFVKKDIQTRIEAELSHGQSPIISVREQERPYSGMLARGGVFMVCKSPRAMLNAIDWKPAGEIFSKKSGLIEGRK